MKIGNWRKEFPDPDSQRDKDLYKPCLHPEHGFPGMLYIPPGRSHTHTCPGCGAKTTVYGSGVHLGGKTPRRKLEEKQDPWLQTAESLWS